jgi:hypothetical protein
MRWGPRRALRRPHGCRRLHDRRRDDRCAGGDVAARRRRRPTGCGRFRAGDDRARRREPSRCGNAAVAVRVLVCRAAVLRRRRLRARSRSPPKAWRITRTTEACTISSHAFTPWPGIPTRRHAACGSRSEPIPAPAGGPRRTMTSTAYHARERNAGLRFARKAHATLPPAGRKRHPGPAATAHDGRVSSADCLLAAGRIARGSRRALRLGGVGGGLDQGFGDRHGDRG